MEYRKAMGGIFGSVFVLGGSLMGFLGGAGVLAVPVVLAGLYASFSALDAILFLPVRIRDGEISFEGRRFSADSVTSVGVAPWRHVGKVRTTPGAAVVITADGRSFHTALCYEDTDDAVAMAQYLAGFLSAEYVASDSDVVVTTDLPGPSELMGRALRATTFRAKQWYRLKRGDQAPSLR
jgi:hypothetical protein